jgi:signal transduction histidine kinase
MNLAALLIPPSLDAKQALRLRRFGLAALSYALAAALVAVAWTFGELPASVVLEVAAAFLAFNLGLYLVIRSGFNLRFDDPSLTRFQILAAITVLMYIVYHMDDGRSVALFGCFFVFLFGIFRLNAREFTVVTLYALAAYALVIVLLMHLRPQAIHDVPREWMSWVMFAGWLPLFTVIGGQINTLRRRLRESELRFRSLTEMSSDFYWESDTGHRLTQRGSADKKLSAVSVFRQGAQVGQRRWEIPYLSPDEAGWQAHRALLDAHLPFRDFELSRVGLDGTERHISISGDPVFDKSGAFKGYRGVGTDITARKLAEEALKQEHARLLEAERDLLKAHESLAEADRLESVGRLAAGVAHEVKNPLTIIRFGIDHLSRQFSQERNQEVLDDVRGAIDRAEHVISDLLDFSRQKTFARRPTDIDQVIDKAIHLVKHEIERRNIAIVRNGSNELPPIYADPDRLVQVFINLLSNAAQSIAQDGRIDVVTRSLRLGERDLERSEGSMFSIGEPVVTVDIRDNGPGFSAAHEKKLFEPFFTTKPVGEGSGLGLAVSRNIVIMHRGSISISNRAEGGVSALLMFRVAREHLSDEKANTGSR